jgi:hypothetical protein
MDWLSEHIINTDEDENDAGEVDQDREQEIAQ